MNTKMLCFHWDSDCTLLVSSRSYALISAMIDFFFFFFANLHKMYCIIDLHHSASLKKQDTLTMHFRKINSVPFHVLFSDEQTYALCEIPQPNYCKRLMTLSWNQCFQLLLWLSTNWTPSQSLKHALGNRPTHSLCQWVFGAREAHRHNYIV